MHFRFSLANSEHRLKYVADEKILNLGESGCLLLYEPNVITVSVSGILPEDFESLIGLSRHLDGVE